VSGPLVYHARFGEKSGESIILGKCLKCQCHAAVEVLGEGKMVKVRSPQNVGLGFENFGSLELDYRSRPRLDLRPIARYRRLVGVQSESVPELLFRSNSISLIEMIHL
jgi:hypothetical protein